MAVTLLHLSDLHFGAKYLHLKDVLSQGLDKGLLGYYNLKLNPKRRFNPKKRQAALDKALQLPWDQFVFTGDVSNLSLDFEFSLAKKALEPFFKKSGSLFIPGNHDYYTNNAKFEHRLENYFGEVLPKFVEGVCSVDLDENWRAILINQAAPNAFYDSRGWFNAEAFGAELDRAKGKRIVVVGHYAAFLPQGIKEAKLHKLFNLEAFETMILEANVELYLHGHIHKSWAHRPFAEHKLQTVCSGGTAKHAKGPWAGFHLITLSDEVSIQRIMP